MEAGNSPIKLMINWAIICSEVLPSVVLENKAKIHEGCTSSCWSPVGLVGGEQQGSDPVQRRTATLDKAAGVIQG